MAMGCADRADAPVPAVPRSPAVDAGVSIVSVAPVAPAAPVSAVADHVELTFTGDVMFGGTFRGTWVPYEAGTFDPLAEIAAKLDSDFVLPNLETTVVETIPVRSLVGDLRFAARPDQVAVLPRHGIRAVTIANNHAADLDGPGVIETALQLAKLGITAFGAARTDGGPRVETIEVRGWRLGVIAATVWLNRGQRRAEAHVPLLAPKDFARTIVPLVEAARKTHDLVIVTVHWGIQYADNPEAWQVAAARQIIDAGADAVIGHHPHLLQRIERYKHGVIAYSLGNFMFNNSLPFQRNTGILRLGFSAPSHCLDLVVLHPAAMFASPVHHPKPATGKQFDEIVQRMQRLAPKDTPITVDSDRLVVAADCPR